MRFIFGHLRGHIPALAIMLKSVTESTGDIPKMVWLQNQLGNLTLTSIKGIKYAPFGRRTLASSRRLLRRYALQDKDLTEAIK